MSQNIFSVEGLISWLETQPGETEYDYVSNTDCLLCRYFKARGVPVKYMSPSRWIDYNGERHLLPGAEFYGDNNPLNLIANDFRAKRTEHTYDAALYRARAMVAS